MNQPLFLSVVIPCYNEEKNIEQESLQKVYDFLSTRSYSWEVIVVDDGSSDKSVGLVEQFCSQHAGFRLIKNPHQGKAYTVMTGMLAGQGKYVLFSDFDQATPISQIDTLIPWFENGFDIVIGSRRGRRRGAPLSRIIMARGFMMLRSVILGLSDISDTQCGFKAFRREVAHDVFGRLKVYGQKKLNVSGNMVSAGFDVETLFVATKLGYKIKEVPVKWEYKDSKHVGAVKDSIQGLMDMLTLRLNAWKGLYDKR